MKMTQEETAAWMGVPVHIMNHDQDHMYRIMEDVLNVRSHHMLMTGGDRDLASLEEAAVLAVQRYWYAATGRSDPKSFRSK